jgi:hypothetical protein
MKNNPGAPGGDVRHGNRCQEEVSRADVRSAHTIQREDNQPEEMISALIFVYPDGSQVVLFKVGPVIQ